jgi:hypothetical protein
MILQVDVERRSHEREVSRLGDLETSML